MWRTLRDTGMTLACVALVNACSKDKNPTSGEPDAASGESSAQTGSTSSGSTAQGSSGNASPAAGLDAGRDENTQDATVDHGFQDAAKRPLPDASVGDGAPPNGDAGVGQLELPPINAGFDYQLGGGYELPQGVTVVARDRTDTPVPGAYNICYVNGFQVQPGEEDDWEADLLLRDDEGEVVIDEDWNEVLLDVSTAEKRERIAAVVGSWIEQCKADGFQAVEVDNLDTFSRSDGRIEQDDAVEFMALLVVRAHDASLAIAQKNSVELVPRRSEMGTDFVVAEACNTWKECDGYIEGYGFHVLMIEYEQADFERGCTLYGDEFSIVYRDKKLVLPSVQTYVYDGC